jgi:hypothetical protein
MRVYEQQERDQEHARECGRKRCYGYGRPDEDAANRMAGEYGRVGLRGLRRRDWRRGKQSRACGEKAREGEAHVATVIDLWARCPAALTIETFGKPLVPMMSGRHSFC